MGWIDELRGAMVGLDTAPLIYFIEEAPNYLEKVSLFFQAMERGDFLVVTSTITLTEVLVHPLQRKDVKLATEYKNILLNSKLMVLDVSSAIAQKAASLRSNYKIRTPDAIQLSAALEAGASYFFTNDIRLPEIPPLQILSLDALV